ncbi:MAG: histidine kinase [Akkermansiaceae bacterium]
MKLSCLLALVAASFPFASAIAQEGALLAGLVHDSTTQLEQHQKAIAAELSELALDSLNSGVGPIGYRSQTHESSDHREWVEVDLGPEGPIDTIVLVPAVCRDTRLSFVSDAFPVSFRVLAGTAADRVGAVVAEYTDTASLLPRIAPLVLPIREIRASWVRVEATRLSPRAFDGKFIFQLSELLVFEGQQNRALRRPVSASSLSYQKATNWSAVCLVDGILPYLMDAAQGEQSLAFLTPHNFPIAIGDRPSIAIDLGQETPVSGLRLHTVDQSDTVPQSLSGDYGLPYRFRLEGSQGSDFSDARVLLEATLGSVFKVGPIMEWNFSEATCRHLRLTASEPYDPSDSKTSGKQIGFAEIEILSKSLNVARGKPVTTALRPSTERTVEALNDGRNLYGNILPIRTWLGELARRHDLEAARPVIAVELGRRYARQKFIITGMLWVTTALTFGIVVLIFYFRISRIRQESRIRERIAANLHDELGANLHAIGLLGDLAKDAVDSREELIDTVERIRALTERTGSAARNCANMLEAPGICEDLVVEMQRDSRRLLADLEHDLQIEGEPLLKRLSRRKRIDLLLFYKETLANVIRHSGATEVETRLLARPNEITLTVTDNGCGFSSPPPAALKRRAGLLGGLFQVEHPASGGTRIILKLKTRQFGMLK